MRIALIGLGEVGSCFALSLSSQASDLRLYDATSTANQERLAKEIKAELLCEIGPELADCDMVLSAVTGGAAHSVATKVARHGAEGSVFIDLTTAAPGTKRTAAEELSAAGLEMVDLAIMGAISLKGVATPLTAAGDVHRPRAAQALQLLESSGCLIQYLDDSRAGDAVALKLLRSVFTKGMEALAVECLIAAEHLGLRQELYSALADIDATPLSQFLEMLVSTHVVHAKRRSSEVAEAESLLHAAGLSSHLTPAVRTLFEETAARLEANPITEIPSPEEALGHLRKLNSSQTTSSDTTSSAKPNHSRTA